MIRTRYTKNQAERDQDTLNLFRLHDEFKPNKDIVCHLAAKIVSERSRSLWSIVWERIAKIVKGKS